MRKMEMKVMQFCTFRSSVLIFAECCVLPLDFVVLVMLIGARGGSVGVVQ